MPPSFCLPAAAPPRGVPPGAGEGGPPARKDDRTPRTVTCRPERLWVPAGRVDAWEVHAEIFGAVRAIDPPRPAPSTASFSFAHPVSGREPCALRLVTRLLRGRDRWARAAIAQVGHFLR